MEISRTEAIREEKRRLLEERQEELRQEAEQGRRAKIAGEVLKEFLDERREKIIREFEEKYLDNGSIYDNLADLRSIRKFREKCNALIQEGEIAEERLATERKLADGE